MRRKKFNLKQCSKCKSSKQNKEEGDLVQLGTIIKAIKSKQIKNLHNPNFHLINYKLVPKLKYLLTISIKNLLKISWSNSLFILECYKEWWNKRTKLWKKLNSIDWLFLIIWQHLYTWLQCFISLLLYFTFKLSLKND